MCVILDQNGLRLRRISIPESVLHKRHNAINYHIVPESVAADIVQVGTGKEDNERIIAHFVVPVSTEVPTGKDA